MQWRNLSILLLYISSNTEKLFLFFTFFHAGLNQISIQAFFIFKKIDSLKTVEKLYRLVSGSNVYDNTPTEPRTLFWVKDAPLTGV